MTNRKQKDKVKEQLIEAVYNSLSAQHIPWRRPWKRAGAYRNAVTNTEYGFSNAMVLELISNARGYRDPRWATFKQAQAQGWKVIPGSKGTPIWFYRQYDKVTKQDFDKKTISNLSDEQQRKYIDDNVSLIKKHYFVFNAEQLDGIHELEMEDPTEYSNEFLKNFTDDALKEMGVPLNTNGTQAYYMPGSDSITMPNIAVFYSEDSYYATLLHEMGHATGHPSRLDRDLSGAFGYDKYAFEELVAELNSMLLGVDLNIVRDTEDIENTKAYCQAWAKQIKDNPDVFLDALDEATAAHDYIAKAGELEKRIQMEQIGEGVSTGYIPGSEMINVFDKLQEKLIEESSADIVEKASILLEEMIIENDLDLSIDDIRVYGSFAEGKDTNLSDIDILVGYRGEFREDNLFNILNEKELQITLMDGTERKVDFNPINLDEQSLEDYLQHISTLDYTVGDNEEPQMSEKKQPTLDDLKSSVSIVDYADEVLGLKSVKTAGGLLQLVDHDSCKIYPNNTFVRFSQVGTDGKTVGGSIVDFIKHFEDVDTRTAINKLKDYYLEHEPQSLGVDVNQGRPRRSYLEDIEIPSPDANNKNVFAYLVKTRCIKPEIVNHYLKHNYLYQDEMKNCVWLGKYDGKVMYAMQRGSNSNSDFKREVSGSFKEVGVYVDNKSDTLVVTESVIDQMSYQSLEPNYKGFNYLAVGGTGGALGAVNFHMKKREEAASLDKVIFALDNDEAGLDATIKLREYFLEKYPHIDCFINQPNAKDFNEDLVLAVKGEPLQLEQSNLNQDIDLQNDNGLGLGLVDTHS